MDNTLLINRLRVTGDLGCDYTFGPGLNIFKGSNSTGKTTLMWFIDFAFGSGVSSKDFVSPVKENCEWVYLDITINEKDFTIKRNLRTPQNIDVYEGNYQNLSELLTRQGKAYGRTQSKKKESLTSFFFNNLGIQQSRVPISQAKMANYSWRNLMSLIFVRQDRWNGILAQYNFQPEMKSAIFEVFMGIDDASINQQEEEKRETSKLLDETRAREIALKQIVDQMDRKLGFTSSIDELKIKISLLKEEKANLINELEMKNESGRLLNDREEVLSTVRESVDQIGLMKQRLDELQMLQSENELSLEKNRLLLKARKIFSELPITKCPRCLNSLEDKGTTKCFVCGQQYTDIDSGTGYTKNLFLLMDESKELTKLIQSEQNELTVLENKKQTLEDNLALIDQKIASLKTDVITPILKITQSIDVELNALNKQLGEAENISGLLQQEKETKQFIKDTSLKIQQIQHVINELRKDRIPAEEVKTRLSDIMTHILSDELNLDDKLHGFDRHYIPITGDTKPMKAGREDINKSKGAKVILGYYTAILEYSLKFGSYHPKLLLLDTPHQDELDMSVFGKLLNYWDRLSVYNKPFQIIITGSEFPANVGRIIAEFHNGQASGDHSKPDKFSVYPIKLP